jgi:hypothetical protein
MGKVVEMKDVVSAVLVLAKTDQVTGEVLHVDGRSRSLVKLKEASVFVAMG